MIDAFDMAFNTRYCDAKFFYARSTWQYQQWQKPRGCNMIYIMAIGAGAGGGGGATAATSTVKSGGGGGSSGGIALVMGPAFLFPDTLYCSVGGGGAGGAAGTGGSVGTRSFVNVLPITNNPLLLSLTADAVAGGGGSGATGGTAGTAGTGATQQALPAMLIWDQIVNQAGVAGGASGAVGGSFTPLANTFLNGGAGGGGVTAGNVQAAGGSSAAVTNWLPQINGGAVGGNPGIRGSDTIGPFFGKLIGGTGGGGNSTGTGGVGGNGSIGCGGGGGGAGLTGGAGGRGGDGLIIILAW